MTVVVFGGAAMAGAVVGGQAREPELPKMIVANKVTEPVPVTAVITRMPVVKLEPGVQIELGPETIATLKEERIVRMARVEWEYRELRVPTSPASYRSILPPLVQAGADGWETTGITFSDSGATVVILKRQR
jgi:hypothetical protein